MPTGLTPVDQECEPIASTMSPRAKILVVDDDPISLDVMNEVLGGEYDLITASSGEEAIQQARSHHPELVLLDIMMPGMDGYETSRRIRADASVNPVKIVLVSSKATLPERLAGYDSGADDYLTKPFDPMELKAKVKVFAHLRRVEVESEQLLRLNQRLESEVRLRRDLEDRLRHDAMYDHLTSLPNRALLIDRIDRCIGRAKRQPDHRFAVLFLDVDDFKVLNDSLGHHAGDKLLREISNRLLKCVRSIDTIARPIEDTVARLGGDEFVVLLEGIESPKDATQVAERIEQMLAQPTMIDDHEIVCTVSIGIATNEIAYDHPDDILRDADTALYGAKAAGKRGHRTFELAMRTQAVERLRVRNDLRRAIEHRQLCLHYQPIVRLPGGELAGFEALIRWDHPELGLVPPDYFIRIAEETGLIIPIGQWVLDEACRQMQCWRDRFKLDRASISVNVSGKQLLHANFLEQADRALSQSGLPASQLNLEVTESVVLENTDVVVRTLKAFERRGIGLRMDDFGTGYSSLSSLNSFPFSVIKLDRSFIKTVTVNDSLRSTVEAVITMCHKLGKKVCAEGVESIHQLDLLQILECDFGQGYFFSRPVDATTVERELGTGGRWAKRAMKTV